MPKVSVSPPLTIIAAATTAQPSASNHQKVRESHLAREHEGCVFRLQRMDMKGTFAIDP